MSDRGFDAVRTADAVIVGGGAAGLSAALALADRDVVLVSKTAFGRGGASPMAQGGMAAAVGPGDSPPLHAADTLAAAAGVADFGMVEILTREGPGVARRLEALGVRFDRDPGGAWQLGHEAAHSRPRILHARDRTGAELMRGLAAAVLRLPRLEVMAETFVEDLWIDGGRVAGVVGRAASGARVAILAPAVVLATGGIGRLFERTTNPPEATGDGLAMAARAGATLVDLEFVQFHPTALAVEADPMPLLTEALRGGGAVLLDSSGRRFMPAVHAAAELAPRDVVARELWRRGAAGEMLFLDCRPLAGHLAERFPGVLERCRRHGFDPRSEPVPVLPAAHYHMGGIWTDGAGRTSLPGLWACGECASTGVHGANRLASNSLLEAVVVGERVAKSVAAAGSASPSSRRSAPSPAEPGRIAAAAADAAAVGREIRHLLWRHVGLARDEAGLAAALARLDALGAEAGALGGETRNLLEIGRLVTRAAMRRRESRGSHFRTDFPSADPVWQRRLAVTPRPAAPRATRPARRAAR